MFNRIHVLLAPALAFVFVVHGAARAQAIDSALAYYPLAVGDTWQYEVNTHAHDYQTTTVTGDTLMPDGMRYFRLAAPYSTSYQRIDSATGDVFEYHAAPGSAAVVLALRCDGHDTLLSYMTVGCNPKSQDTVLGVATLVAGGLAGKGTRARYALGFGLTDWIVNYDSPEDVHQHLVYARINGREFGRRVSAVTSASHAGKLDLQAAPNPCSSHATIAFTLPVPQHAIVCLYDALGRRVAVLADAAFDAGEHRCPLDADGLADGTYFCRLTTDAGTMTRSLLIVR